MSESERASPREAWAVGEESGGSGSFHTSTLHDDYLESVVIYIDPARSPAQELQGLNRHAEGALRRVEGAGGDPAAYAAAVEAALGAYEGASQQVRPAPADQKEVCQEPTLVPYFNSIKQCKATYDGCGSSSRALAITSDLLESTH